MKKYLIFFLFIGIPLFIYFHNFQDDFMWDDGSQVYKNEEVKNLNFENIKIIFTTCASGMYQPVTSVFYGLIAILFGVKSTFPYHVFSFFLHILNTFLVFVIARKIFKNKTKAVFLALLFTGHYMAVESVAYISATSNLSYAFFFFISIWFYMKKLEENGKRKYYFWSLLFFTIGCFCKVQIIALVGTLFVVDYLYKKPIFSKKRLLDKIPFAFIALVFGIIGIYFRSVSLNVNKEMSIFDNAYFGLNQITNYILKISLFPVSYYKSFIGLNITTHIHVFLFLILAYSLYHFRKNRLYVFGIFFFLMNIILHTTFFTKTEAPYGDRYTYIAAIGLWIAVLSFIDKKRHYYILTLFAVILVFSARVKSVNWSNYQKTLNNSLVVNSGKDWYLESSELYEKRYYITKNSDLVGVCNNLGIVFLKLDMIDVAEIFFLKTIDLDPTRIEAHKNLASYFFRRDSKTAEKYFLEVLKIQPNSYDSYVNLGFIYSKSDLKKAEECFLKALYLNPNSHVAFMNLGIIYNEQKNLLAEDYFLQALRLNKSDLKLYKNLVTFYKESDPDRSKFFLSKIGEISAKKENWEIN